MEEKEMKKETPKKLTHNLSMIGWGLFLVWIGIALLLGIDTGTGIFGVGVIVLGMQIARKYFSMKLEKAWVVIGLILVVAGLWDVGGINIPVVPLIIIAGGVLLLISTVRNKQ